MFNVGVPLLVQELFSLRHQKISADTNSGMQDKLPPLNEYRYYTAFVG